MEIFRLLFLKYHLCHILSQSPFWTVKHILDLLTLSSIFLNHSFILFVFLRCGFRIFFSDLFSSSLIFYLALLLNRNIFIVIIFFLFLVFLFGSFSDKIDSFYHVLILSHIFHCFLLLCNTFKIFIFNNFTEVLMNTINSAHITSVQLDI